MTDSPALPTTARTASVEPSPVRLALAVLVPSEEITPKENDAKTSDPQGRAWQDSARLVDPYYALIQFATVWVDIKFTADSDAIKIELPYKSHEDMIELLETVYLLHGWAGMDNIIEQVQRSLVASVVDLLGLPKDEIGALAVLLNQPQIYLTPDHIDQVRSAIEVLLLLLAEKKQATARAVGAGLKALIPMNSLFSYSMAQARIQLDVAGNLEAAARLFADVVVSLRKARYVLEARVLTTLLRVESEAHRLLLSMLMDARATIVRETMRYFVMTAQASAKAVLEYTKNVNVPVDTVSTGALRKALQRLEPFAHDVVHFTNHYDQLKHGSTPSDARRVEAQLKQKCAIYSRELGRNAQEFPVLYQINVEDVEPAARAKLDDLGDIVFKPLKRAYQANLAMYSRAKAFHDLSSQVNSELYPDRALAKEIIAAGKAMTVWGYPKYVERALDRIAGDGDDFTRKVIKDVSETIQLESGEVAAAVGQAAAEITALGLASHFVPRFVPVLNITLGAWHIATAVEEFQGKVEEFYCALDPRDALTKAAPSFEGLVVDVLGEAIFAFI